MLRSGLSLLLVVATYIGVKTWFGGRGRPGPEPKQTFEEMLCGHRSRSIGEECDWCRNSLRGNGSQKCSGCEVTFCSLECEQKAAEWHVTCSPHPFRPVTTADTLYCAVQRYSLPEDAQTLEDYGFTKVWTRTEKIYLVCVYQTAMHGFRKSPTEIHAWRTSGTLQEHFQRDIAEELISGVQQGDVWGWFFRNVDLFRPPASSIFPRTSTAREGYSNWKEMPPRILDSIACMRDAVHLNVIPKNPNTLADYGFTRTDQRDHGMLLAVYTVLFIDKGVYPSDILLLCDAGILKNNIIAKMHSPLPRVTPPHVLEWFENNLYVFEDDKPVSLWEVSS
ncbi:hypothetical protein B0H17DRAFT_1113724 [Mycena rosella]|uniref:MYND-type domain-containing protein n=1 Tax=Mycena rosella TaxID=1033263 RepID=A0AAD7FHI6_MYCRO|nr:hypothetical protein B0H17DRAFT_1113724 [Mycena rosella]